MNKPIAALGFVAATFVIACQTLPSSEEAVGSTTSHVREPSDEILENARISRPSPGQIRLESAIREECKGRKTIFDVKVGNNTESDVIRFSAVAHGYRNGEWLPVQVTRIGRFAAGPLTVENVSFDGEYPGTKGAAIEIVSVTLDALGDSTLDDLGVEAHFTCGEVEDTIAGFDPGTSEIENTSAVSCATLGTLRGAAMPMCEFNGNGACSGEGAATNDCEHCCQATGPGTTAPLR